MKKANKYLSELVLFLIILFMFGGCGVPCLTMEDFNEGTRIVRLYNNSFDEIWSAMPSVIASLGFEYCSSSKNEQDGYVIARRGVNLRTFGDHVAFHIYTRGKSRTSVEVIFLGVTTANFCKEPILSELNKRFNPY